MAQPTNDPSDAPVPRDASEDGVGDELVEIFDTEDEAEANVVKSLLESAGIDALVSSLDAQQNLLPGVGGVIVRVRADQAQDAKQLIEQSRQNSLTEDTDTSEDPPAA
jgi:hypothetical protein